MKRLIPHVLLLSLCLSLGVGCAAAPRAPLEPSFAQPIAQAPPQAAPLQDNHFRSDRTGNLTESQLKEILDAPIFLEEETRLGIVLVATAYEVDRDLSLTHVPHELGQSLERTGFFEITTEVSTDWPKDHSVAGLRELAARYRAKYLLLYRHRFVERDWTNGWGWAYLTGVGALFVPANTVETAGVMEATLFDVRTGTILFTVYERVHKLSDMNVWNNEEKRREIKTKLLTKASDQLSEKVTHKVRRLVAARPSPPKPQGEAEAQTAQANPQAQPSDAPLAQPATPDASAPASSDAVNTQTIY